MKFEFDPSKSTLNKIKHGIDFAEAQHLWDDPRRLLIPARTSDEPRFILIAKYSEKHWSAVFTMRAESIRVISVRRSRQEEVDLYEI